MRAAIDGEGRTVNTYHCLLLIAAAATGEVPHYGHSNGHTSITIHNRGHCPSRDANGECDWHYHSYGAAIHVSMVDGL